MNIIIERYPLEIRNVEHRAIGKFSAAEVRELAPGLSHAMTRGCPLSIAESILEKNAANRAGRSIVTAPVVKKNHADEIRVLLAESDAARRERLARTSEVIRLQETEIDHRTNPVVSDDHRRARAQELADRIHNEATEAWLREPDFKL